MIMNIKDSFKDILKESDWMDEQSKKMALEKAEMIDIKIGYPDFTYNNTHLNHMYRDVIN
jgi:neprilysin